MKFKPIISDIKDILYRCDSGYELVENDKSGLDPTELLTRKRIYLPVEPTKKALQSILSSFLITEKINSIFLKQEIYDVLSDSSIEYDELMKYFLKCVIDLGSFKLTQEMTEYSKSDWSGLNSAQIKSSTELGKGVEILSSATTLISKKINLQYFQKKILIADKNTQLYSELQVKAMNILLSELFKFPRNDNRGIYDGISPTHIIESKEIVCTGHILIASGLLNQLNIYHEYAEVLGHSALIVYDASGNQYFFDPYIYNSLINLKEISYLNTGNYLTYFSNALKIDPLVFQKFDLYDGLLHMFFYVKAKELYTQKNYLEAINHFYNALKINDQFCKTYYYLALCYYETGDKTKALIYLEKSLELYPDLNKSKDLYEKIKDFESL